MQLNRLTKTIFAVFVASITLTGVLNAAMPLRASAVARVCMHDVGTCPGDCADWCNLYYQTQNWKCASGCCTCLY